VSFFEEQYPKFSLEEFHKLLGTYGFTDHWDIELLTGRFFYGMSYRQIAADLNYTSRDTARRRIRRLLELFQERGIKDFR
jgi:hypothetical protein